MIGKLNLNIHMREREIKLLHDVLREENLFSFFFLTKKFKKLRMKKIKNMQNHICKFRIMYEKHINILMMI